VPADQQQASEHLHRRVANEEHIKHAEVQRQTRDGRRLDVSLTLSPVRGDDGRVIGIAGSERDITDRKRDERALQAANTALQRKSEEMQEFFSIIAHDLKHPVVGVQGLLSMLELDAGDKLDAMSQENLKLALNECEQMKGMLAQLSQLGRIERRRVELVRRRLDAFVQGCADRFRAAMRDCGGQILVDADEAEVSFAASIVGEAVSNLIDNAIKYGCKAGDRRVMITARAREAMASIEVRDFGPGIAPQQHERIFQLFRRLDAAEHTAGSGVGLAAVRALVHRLGGDVSVVSDRGKGAAFTVEFPIDRVAESVNDEAVEPERKDTGNA
jgi:signal transduction histidine kinase